MNNERASFDTIFTLASRMANRINSRHPTQEQVNYVIQNNNSPIWTTIDEVFGTPIPESAEEKHAEDETPVVVPTASLPKILRGCGPSFQDWLKAREILHKFLTGETIVLRDMFVISDELLARTDIIPVFRPAGGSNRTAVEWKKKLGIKVWEETDVMKYKNSEGPKVPELSFINRSIRPDENTLGDNALSPDDLVVVKLEENTSWLNLYGYADADNLHFLITGKHLDPGDTLTWFPNDRLPDGGVAGGSWRSGGRKVGFYWNCAGNCFSDVGARLATSLILKS